MKVIAGLGNPGKKYEGTRHNVGFDVVRELSRRSGGEFSPFEVRRVGFRMRVVAWSAGVAGRATDLHESEWTLRSGGSGFLQGRSAGRFGDLRRCQLARRAVAVAEIGLSRRTKGLADIIRQLGTEDVPRLRLVSAVDRNIWIWRTTSSDGSVDRSNRRSTRR